MRVSFDEEAFSDYISWQSEDKKTLKKINSLIKSILRDGLMSGIGKPEVLKGYKAYSRRIDEANRLVYIADNDKNVIVLSCKGHYED